MLQQIKKLAAERGQTFEQVAEQCGVSRFHLRRIALKETPGSVEFWDAMIRWSGGEITPDVRFAAEIERARRDRIRPNGDAA